MQQFIDFITSLAPEGETALFVRQKPKIPLEYHADGAIKATWPAYLPSKWSNKGAWYGNTASYIIDRFTEGRPSASAVCCEYILVLILDDVGTKSQVPPLPPTWIIETSPANFQYGYVFSEQPPKAEYAAAITAIAAAGFTDPGACNPVRNFRLPGSVNLKPGRDNFASRIVEFHPERDFTLAGICAALGVVPGPALPAHRPIRLADDGTDDVLIWLSEQGHLLSRPNGEGWAGVTCPQSDQHTDGNPEGRYLAANRAYCCLHSHCIDFGSADFLAWVSVEGGPKHSPGLREELLAAVMEGTLAKLAPTAAFPDAAAEVIAQAERKQLGRVEVDGWYSRFAYLQDDDAYFDMDDRREIARGTFNALFRHIYCKSIHGKQRVESSVSFDQNRQARGAHSLVGVTYAAGESVLVSRDGLVFGNRWRDARPAPVAGDVTRWLQHVERMIPIEFERRHLLDALAHKVQFPRIKINHALLIAGNHGSGKDTLMAPFFWSIGGGAKINCSFVKSEELSSQWGYTLECEVMEIGELRHSDAKDRRATENVMKPVIAAPPELLPVNRKGLHPYMSLNRILVVAFSNERAAISIPSEDRRWFCIWSEAGKMPEADAVSIWTWYKHQGGYEAVSAYLHTRDVSAFNPAAPPPMTEAKMIMVEHGMSIAESFLMGRIQARIGAFADGVVSSPFHAICDGLTHYAPAGIKLHPAALLHALKEAGWVDCGRIHSVAHPSKKHIFCAPELRGMSKTDLRAAINSKELQG
jgi:hypothetical protein